MPPSQPLVVVVVDDNTDTTYSTAELLALCGFRTHATTCGAEAVRLAIELPADVVVSDLAMPGTDGFEVARRLGGSGAECMLVALSGHCTEADRSASAAAGFHYHFAKPIDPALLIGCLHRMRSLRGGAAE